MARLIVAFLLSGCGPSVEEMTPVVAAALDDGRITILAPDLELDTAPRTCDQPPARVYEDVPDGMVDIEGFARECLQEAGFVTPGRYTWREDTEGECWRKWHPRLVYDAQAAVTGEDPLAVFAMVDAIYTNPDRVREFLSQMPLQVAPADIGTPQLEALRSGQRWVVGEVGFTVTSVEKLHDGRVSVQVTRQPALNALGRCLEPDRAAPLLVPGQYQKLFNFVRDGEGWKEVL